MKRVAALAIPIIILISMAGCAGTTLNTVKESRVVYETEAKGTHAQLARCMTYALQNHEKYTVRFQKYAIKNYPEKSEIQAYQEIMNGGNLYLFTVDLQQNGPDSVHVSLRRLSSVKEFVEQAVKSCSAQS